MLKRFSLILLIFILVALQINPAPVFAVTKPTSITFVADIWADNWFALYINGKKVGEDSVSITTTKSFNKERISFTTSYPFTIGLVGRDYVENNSGLEYIGTNRQQIGDAGLIVQIYEKVSKKFVIGTNSTWKSLVTFKAPLNPECEKSENPIRDCKSALNSYPSNWASVTYKDSKWSSSREYTEAEVGVKEGYLEVTWSSKARLIWSEDLKLDNTVLFRKVVTQPEKISPNFSFSLSGVGADHRLLRDFTCDGAGRKPEITWSGSPVGAHFVSLFMTTVPGPPREGEVASSLHYEWVMYNVPADVLKVASTENQGTTGMNFQNKYSYSPPCSQGPGDKTYTFTLYAHASKLAASNDSKSLQDLARNQAIAIASQDFTYSRA